MNIICIDIGNSNIKAALFRDGTLGYFAVFKDESELFNLFNPGEADRLAVCSVHPKRTELILNAAESIIKHPPFIILRDSKINVHLDYETPDTLGFDRVCAAEGALYLQKKSNKVFDGNSVILAVDMGTATTVNILKSPGIFLGGAIAPGISTMFKSLQENTAQLPLGDASLYKGLIGKSTKGSIASGVINSTIGMIEKFINELRSAYSPDKLTLYITGGNAPLIIPYLNYDCVYEKALVCYGIYSIYESNKKGLNFE